MVKGSLNAHGTLDFSARIGPFSMKMHLYLFIWVEEVTRLEVYAYYLLYR